MARKDRALGLHRPFLEVFPSPVLSTTAPGTNDTNYEPGQVWVVNSGDTKEVYIYGGNDSAGDAVWNLSSATPNTDEITFKSSPLATTAANTGGVATGATGATNLLSFDDGLIMEQFILGAGQTIIKPVMDANGLLISLDLVTSEGAEYNFGAARTNSNHAYTIGTDAAFYFEVEMYLADVSGGAPYAIGFRKSEANNATLASYDSYAFIGMNAGTSATNVSLVTELNAGGQTATDTTDTWSDGSSKVLRVLVDASGNVTYTIDGSAPTTTAAFQFDNGDVVCPFIRIEHNADAGAVNLVSLKVGYQ